MVTGEGRPDYPVPWAATAATSALESVDEYASHLDRAGFSAEVVNDRTEAVLAGLAQIAASRQRCGVVGPDVPLAIRTTSL